MKTLKRSTLPEMLIFPVFAILMIVCFSCGEESNTTMKVVDIPAPPDAPPPPPPPPYLLKDGDTVWIQVDEMPVFKGGDAGLLKFITENTSYPVSAKNNGIQGKVIVSFIVGADGNVSDAKIEKSVNTDLDTESLRVVNSLPDFEKPGIKNGKAVPVMFMLPIAFTLN